jgi:hypothetical protein
MQSFVPVLSQYALSLFKFKFLYVILTQLHNFSSGFYQSKDLINFNYHCIYLVTPTHRIITLKVVQIMGTEHPLMPKYDDYLKRYDYIFSSTTFLTLAESGILLPVSTEHQEL